MGARTTRDGRLMWPHRPCEGPGLANQSQRKLVELIVLASLKIPLADELLYITGNKAMFVKLLVRFIYQSRTTNILKSIGYIK